MAKLPVSFRERNRTTRAFREQFQRLPLRVQELTRECCRIFDSDPDHPSLRRKPVHVTRAGSSVPGSFSVSITMRYRAVYVIQDGVNVWYWIGTHAEYDQLLQ